MNQVFVKQSIPVSWIPAMWNIKEGFGNKAMMYCRELGLRAGGHWN
jgi:hypothetical protein